MIPLQLYLGTIYSSRAQVSTLSHRNRSCFRPDLYSRVCYTVDHDIKFEFKVRKFMRCAEKGIWAACCCPSHDRSILNGIGMRSVQVNPTIQGSSIKKFRPVISGCSFWLSLFVGKSKSNDRIAIFGGVFSSSASRN